MAYETRSGQHWQDWITLFLGGWLFLSPWILGFSGNGAAAWNAWLVGLAVAAVSLAALAQFVRWEEWTNIVLGLWLVISPWILGYSLAAAAVWNAVIAGAATAALAAWSLATAREPPRVAAE